jgi:hypothetical protein
MASEREERGTGDPNHQDAAVRPFAMTLALRRAARDDYDVLQESGASTA